MFAVAAAFWRSDRLDNVQTNQRIWAACHAAEESLNETPDPAVMALIPPDLMPLVDLVTAQRHEEAQATVARLAGNLGRDPAEGCGSEPRLHWGF